MEDARLFRDDQGRVRMVFNRHYPLSSLRVSLHVAEVRVQPGTWNISLVNEQVSSRGSPSGELG